MSTKTQIQTLIDTIIDGGLNTAQKVREVFGTGTSSILNNLYGTVISKSKNPNANDTTGIVTAGFDNAYDVQIVKQGRKVTINGTFSTSFASYPFFTIDTATFPEYEQATPKQVGLATSNADGSGLPIYLLNNALTTDSYAADGEVFNFSITYNTLN